MKGRILRFMAVVAALIAASAVSEAQNRIVVSKSDFRLYVLDSRDSVVYMTDVCLGMNLSLIHI